MPDFGRPSQRSGRLSAAECYAVDKPDRYVKLSVLQGHQHGYFTAISVTQGKSKSKSVDVDGIQWVKRLLENVIKTDLTFNTQSTIFKLRGDSVHSSAHSSLFGQDLNIICMIQID